jgi:hypothetical protein
MGAYHILFEEVARVFAEGPLLFDLAEERRLLQGELAVAKVRSEAHLRRD